MQVNIDISHIEYEVIFISIAHANKIGTGHMIKTRNCTPETEKLCLLTLDIYLKKF